MTEIPSVTAPEQDSVAMSSSAVPESALEPTHLSPRSAFTANITPSSTPLGTLNAARRPSNVPTFQKRERYQHVIRHCCPHEGLLPHETRHASKSTCCIHCNLLRKFPLLATIWRSNRSWIYILVVHPSLHGRDHGQSRRQVRICDFGVSGNLIASFAKTNIVCQSYMTPKGS
jgi:hypothetical protein